MSWIQLLILLAFCTTASPFAADNPPAEWIEPETGHRVIRLSRESGTTKLYFHQNAFTATGDKMLVVTPQGLSTVALATREMEPIVEGRVSQVVVGPKSRRVFYGRGDGIFSTRMDRGAEGTAPVPATEQRGYVTREIAKLPPDWRRGSGLALNANETLLAGSIVESKEPQTTTPQLPQPSRDQPKLPSDVWKPGQGRSLEERWAMRQPMRLFTIGVETGERKSFHASTDWLNHVQFSPTDPGLIMFCHEGPWHKVDRIWTIRTDGTELRKIHTRTMEMEIAGHEFFGADGKYIYYDLQTPKAQVFWLAK